MSCEDAKTCLCIHDAGCNQLQQLAACNLGNEDKNQTGDDKSEDDSSSCYSDTDDEDDRSFFQIEPVKFSYQRSVAEGDVIVRKYLNSYFFFMKEEYKPKDALERRAFCEKFLERAVGRFVSEALRLLGPFGDFEALLTEDEHQKLSGMEEVDEVVQIEHFISLD